MVFDYWKDSEDGAVSNLLKTTRKRVYFLCSHFHEDHFNPDILDFHVADGEKVVLLSRDIRKFKHIGDEEVTRFLKLKEVYEDELLRITVCGSTDYGVSFVVETEGITLYHAGDNNNWRFPKEMDEREMKMMEGSYLAILCDIRQLFDHFDLVMFPIDPRLDGEMFCGALQLLKTIPSKRLAPMHFDYAYEAVGQFAKLASDNGCHFLAIHKTGDVLIDFENNDAS